MSELWEAIRDSIGIDSKIIYNNKSVKIINLPTGLYELYNHKKKITEKKLNPDQIPGTLLNYCLELEEEQTLKGKTLTEIVTNLEIIAKKVK